MIKNPPANRGEADSIPGLGRSPGEGMATHSSVLPWRIPWTEEPGGLSSMGSQRITSWVSWSFQIILSPILIQRNKGGNCEINSSPWQRMQTTYTSRMRFNVISSRKCLHLFSPLLWNPIILRTVIPWYPQGIGSRTTFHTQICRYSVQFSRSVVSDSLWPHELQHTRSLHLSPTAGVHSNSCPLSWWCHPTISSSVIPFSCHQSFPASGSFQMSQLSASGGQSIGVSASTSVLPMNMQDWSPLGWTGWISLQFKGLSRVFSNTTIQKHQFSAQLSS